MIFNWIDYFRVETQNTADGAMTITTKTTITKTNGANGEVVIVEKKEVIAGERLNGNAGELLLYSIAIW